MTTVINENGLTKTQNRCHTAIKVHHKPILTRGAILRIRRHTSPYE